MLYTIIYIYMIKLTIIYYLVYFPTCIHVTNIYFNTCYITNSSHSGLDRYPASSFVDPEELGVIFNQAVVDI